jgi:hypothetical protein
MREADAPCGQRCPFCKGTGRRNDGYACLRCDGAGDRESMLLLRAYRLGAERALEQVNHINWTVPGIGVDELRRSLVADEMAEEREVEAKIGPR